MQGSVSIRVLRERETSMSMYGWCSLGLSEQLVCTCKWLQHWCVYLSPLSVYTIFSCIHSIKCTVYTCMIYVKVPSHSLSAQNLRNRSWLLGHVKLTFSLPPLLGFIFLYFYLCRSASTTTRKHLLGMKTGSPSHLKKKKHILDFTAYCMNHS